MATTSFICRDPAGIRPGYFHIDDEVVAMASERAALANVFDVPIASIEPIEPGHVLIVKKNGAGQWMDDNGGDWTAKVSGADAADSTAEPMPRYGLKT